MFITISILEIAAGHLHLYVNAMYFTSLPNLELIFKKWL
jgi:hypothetical protein